MFHTKETSYTQEVWEQRAEKFICIQEWISDDRIDLTA